MEKIDYLNTEEKCPNCDIKAPKKQIENLGMCERCSMNGYTIKSGEILNPDNNLIDKWKKHTPAQQNQSEGVI